jgi:uncharacterized protein (TIGR02001 family)
MRVAICGFLAAMTLCGPARAGDYGHLVAYLDWTSDYRYAGASESNRQPEIQGGVHWLGPDGFYAGVFATGVRFNDFRNTSYEVDAYAGKKFAIDADTLDLEMLYGLYPNSAGRPTYLPPGAIIAGYDFPELSETYTHAFGALTLDEKAMIEPRAESHGGLLWLAGGGASYAVRDWLKLQADAYEQSARSGPRGLIWDVGASASIGWRYRFDLQYAGATASTADCYGTNWCKPGVVAKVTYTFAIF